LPAEEWFKSPFIINITDVEYKKLVEDSDQDFLILFGKRYDAFVSIAYHIYEELYQELNSDFPNLKFGLVDIRTQ
jgi:hypothetical protein